MTLGTLAGENMAGNNAAYDGVNFFDSAAFDLTLHAWGEAKLVDCRLIRTSASNSSDFIEIGVAPDGRTSRRFSPYQSR